MNSQGSRNAVDNLRVALDDSVYEVTTLAQQCWPEVASFWIPKTVKEVLRAHPAPTALLDPVEAGEYLNALRKHLESMITEMVRSHSSAQWLWYLRRLPDLFSGELATTGPYDRALMELLSAKSSKVGQNFPTRDQQIIYPISEGVVRRVLRLSAMAIVLSDLHSSLRRAGKGTSYKTSDDSFPVAVPDIALEQAIRNYDRRVAKHGQRLTVPGTQVLSRDVRRGDPAPIIGIEPTTWQLLPTWEGSLSGDMNMMATMGHFVPEALSLRNLAHLLQSVEESGPQWWSSSLPSLVALQQALGWYLSYYTTYGWVSLVRYGYVTMPWETLQKMVAYSLPVLRSDLDAWFSGTLPERADDVLREVAEVPIRLWPSEPGPVLRRAGTDVMIDVAAATRHLNYLCTIAPPSQGALANIRGEHFEGLVQALIDSTAWKPSRGAPPTGLKVKPPGKNALTDLDAVGDRNGTLLLVSCKSHPYTPLHDAGDYRTIRNTTTLVHDAVDKWQGLVATLSAHKVGQNYDVRNYDRILGIVCLSQIPYASRADAIAVVDLNNEGQELRMACGYSELAAWLGVEQ